ncbi:MAG: hypothetical protein RIK87_00785 [Fuerstiella sp.]
MLVAVTVLLAVVPDQAFGSCGDYLYRNGKPVSMDSHGHGSSGPVLTDNALPEAPNGHCRGPFCSSNSDSPLQPLPGVDYRLLNDAGLLSTLVHGGTSAPGDRIDLTSDRVASPEGRPVFHPPRAG